jgi:hypothetical protein
MEGVAKDASSRSTLAEELQPMNWKKGVPWIVALPLLGALSFLGSLLGSSNSETLARLFGSRSGPILDCIERIDLGEQEVGQLIAGRLIVTNRGSKELLIDQVQTSCSCTGLQREEEGEFTPVSSLRVGAGEAVHLVVRVSVRGDPGQPFTNFVEFRTNDPARPLVRIEAVISLVTGVTTVPRTLAFGTVLTGAVPDQLVEVHDLSGKRRAIKQVLTNNPDRFSARLLSPQADGVGGKDRTSSTLIGRVEVTLKTEVSGPVDGRVEIQLAGEESRLVSVPVIGLVASDVEVSPTSLVLPRMSSNGLLYSVDCLCRSNKGDPLTVTLDSAPQGIAAELSAVVGNPALQKVRVTWDSSSGDKVSGEARSVRLRASVGGRETCLEIRVYCRSPRER